MKKIITLLSILPLLAPPVTQAAGPFEESDFKWDPFKTLHKRIIIAGVNRIAREKPGCEQLDPASLEHYGGTPDDPEFVVTCGEPGHIIHAYFSKTDVTGDPASNVPLEERAGR